jgi:hypothetical protein
VLAETSLEEATSAWHLGQLDIWSVRKFIRWGLSMVFFKNSSSSSFEGQEFTETFVFINIFSIVLKDL